MLYARTTRQVVAVLLGTGMMAGTSEAQAVYRRGLGYGPTPYGFYWSAPPPANYFNRTRAYPGLPAGAQTVTDFRPLIRAITSLPGWNSRPTAPHRPPRSQPAVSADSLLTADGKILWPDNTPSDTRSFPAKQDAEQAVSLVVREHSTYGQATIRHVADARNKLTEFARRSLPSLRARDSSAANQLERFIVELQKTLVTMTAHY
jgi:hypothetical protein